MLTNNCLNTTNKTFTLEYHRTELSPTDSNNTDISLNDIYRPIILLHFYKQSQNVYVMIFDILSTPPPQLTTCIYFKKQNFYIFKFQT